MLTNRWRSQTQQTSKFTSFTMSCPLCTQEVTVHLHVDYTHACSHNHTSLSQSRPQFLASRSPAKHLFTFYVNTSQNTAMCILPPGSSQKAFTLKTQTCQILKHFFSPFISRSLVGDLLYPHPLHWDQWMQKQSTLYKEREWVVQKVEGGGGNKGRQLWGLALHAVSSPFGTIIIRIRLAVVTGGGHLLTLLT